MLNVAIFPSLRGVIVVVTAVVVVLFCFPPWPFKLTVRLILPLPIIAVALVTSWVITLSLGTSELVESVGAVGEVLPIVLVLVMGSWLTVIVAKAKCALMRQEKIIKLIKRIPIL